MLCCTRSLIRRPDCYGSLDPVVVPPKTPRVEITHTSLVGPLRVSFIPLIDDYPSVGHLQITRVFHTVVRYYCILRRCRGYPLRFRSICSHHNVYPSLTGCMGAQRCNTNGLRSTRNSTNHVEVARSSKRLQIACGVLEPRSALAIRSLVRFTLLHGCCTLLPVHE